MLPILHLNGYKIANPTVPARIPERSSSLMRGYGYTVDTVDGHDPREVHQRMAATLDRDPRDPRDQAAAAEGDLTRPAWPVLISGAQGLDLPEIVDGVPVERNWRRTRCRSPPHGPTRGTWPAGVLDALLSAGGTLRPSGARPESPGSRRLATGG